MDPALTSCMKKLVDDLRVPMVFLYWYMKGSTAEAMCHPKTDVKKLEKDFVVPSFFRIFV